MGSVIYGTWSSVTRGKFSPYFWVADSNKILAYLCAVSAFMFFRGLNIGHNKIINALGGSTFGVLLIHANSDAMRQWLWNDILDCAGAYKEGAFLLVHVVASVGGIFLICACIDMLRIRFIEKPLLKIYDKRIEVWKKQFGSYKERSLHHINKLFSKQYVRGYVVGILVLGVLFTFYQAVAETKYYSYPLGTVLSFDAGNATANRYCRSGFSQNEHGFTWTDGTKAEMWFDVNGTIEQLEVTMECHAYTGMQEVEIYVNDTLITTLEITELSTYSFDIPKAYLNRKVMKLKMVIPGAVSPLDMGENGDLRKLGLAMKNIKIDLADDN